MASVGHVESERQEAGSWNKGPSESPAGPPLFLAPVTYSRAPF